jgi:hypothetical protein
MTRAYDYIYTIFGLEASHTNLSDQAPSIKLVRARWGGLGPRGSLMRTNESKRFPSRLAGVDVA